MKSKFCHEDFYCVHQSCPSYNYNDFCDECLSMYNCDHCMWKSADCHKTYLESCYGVSEECELYD